MQPIKQDIHRKQEIELFLMCTYYVAQASARWLTRQSETLQAYVEDQSKREYFRLKSSYPDTDISILSKAIRLKTTHAAHSLFKQSHRKNSNFTSHDVVLNNLLEMESFTIAKRVSLKEDTINRNMPRILKWREQGISFNQIATKILTIDGKSISAEYIRKTLNEKRGI